mmetsp:Transcript_41098/g.107938  ORF Transcript_41098/g.107938 Transcript_41098/m.107938 type:complete len:203 (-) Transcript_41098:2128-2736(-)
MLTASSLASGVPLPLLPWRSARRGGPRLGSETGPSSPGAGLARFRSGPGTGWLRCGAGASWPAAVASSSPGRLVAWTAGSPDSGGRPRPLTCAPAASTLLSSTAAPGRPVERGAAPTASGLPPRLPLLGPTPAASGVVPRLPLVPRLRCGPISPAAGDAGRLDAVSVPRGSTCPLSGDTDRLRGLRATESGENTAVLLCWEW